jgi:hypothetical protein
MLAVAANNVLAATIRTNAAAARMSDLLIVLPLCLDSTSMG